MGGKKKKSVKNCSLSPFSASKIIKEKTLKKYIFFFLLDESLIDFLKYFSLKVKILLKTKSDYKNEVKQRKLKWLSYFSLNF